MPRDQSTSTLTVKLIEMVRCHPVLYDMAHYEFKNTFLKSKLWEEIGKKLNMDGNSARTKWKNLRDSYSKYLKSLKTTTGQSAAKIYDRYNKWQWASNMEFLRDHIGFATTDTNVIPNVTPDTESESQNSEQNINEPINSTSDHSFSTPSPQPATVNRKRNNRCDDERGVDKVIKYLSTRQPDKNMSSTEHLMIGYAKTIDSFSERRRILIKMKIAQIIMEGELEEQEERNRLRGPQPPRHELEADARPSTSACSMTSDHTNSSSARSYYNSLSTSNFNLEQDPLLLSQDPLLLSQDPSLLSQDPLLSHNSHGQVEQEYNIDVDINAQPQSKNIPGTSNKNISQEIRCKGAASIYEEQDVDYERVIDSFTSK